jgi:potassium/hydrogen antiporter
MEIALIIVIVGIFVFLAHIFAAIFSRTKIPDVLELMLLGVLIGPIFHLVAPAHFGAVGPVFTTITLVVILFESGIGLSLHSLLQAFRGTLALTSINFLATMVIVGTLTTLMTNLGLLIGFLLGAIIGGTSSAVVIPMVCQLKMKEESRAVLVLESAVSDVFTIVVSLALLETLKLGELHFGTMTGRILASFFLSTIIGICGAFIWSMLLQRVRMLQNDLFTTPSFVFIIYGISELLGYSGAITALAFGITLGNIELFKIPIIKRFLPLEPIALNSTEKLFFSEIVFLLKTFFFIYIGISIQLTNSWWVSFGLLLTFLLFIIRIPVVRFSLQKPTLSEDASLMAAMVPKGLAAAVMASIPLQQEIAGGALIQNVTYAVILFSIILTSLLIFFVQKTKLGKLYQLFFR